MPFHIHTRSAERDSLHTQPESLLRAALPSQPNCASRAKHSVPGQSRNLPQDLYHLPRRTRPARGPRHRAVARYLSRGQSANRPHHAPALVIERVLGSRFSFGSSLSRRSVCRHDLGMARASSVISDLRVSEIPPCRCRFASTKIYITPSNQRLR